MLICYYSTIYRWITVTYCIKTLIQWWAAKPKPIKWVMAQTHTIHKRTALK